MLTLTTTKKAGYAEGGTSYIALSKRCDKDSERTERMIPDLRITAQVFLFLVTEVGNER